MSNVTANNPVILDTAATIFATTIKVKPKKLKWIGESIADGDELKISDVSGVIFRHFATADDTGVEFAFPPDYACFGFVLNTISHGECYVWF